MLRSIPPRKAAKTLYFYSLIAPKKSIWRRAIGYSLFTGFIGVWLLLLAQQLPIIRSIYAGTTSEHFIPRMLGYIFGVGIFEELCKAAPLLIFGLRKNRIHGYREGLFLGFMSGLGFAAAEGVLYTVGATVEAAHGGSFTVQMLQAISRFMNGPLLHGAWAGTVGWFIGIASLRQESRWPIVIVGIFFMAVLHGIDDTFSNSPIQIFVEAVSILIFMAYLIHGEEEQAAKAPIAQPVTATNVA